MASWANLNEEERKAEMARRMGMRKATKRRRATVRRTKRKKQQNRSMECPMCHKQVSLNNINRHLSVTHQLKKREVKRVLNGTQEAAIAHQAQGGATADFSNDISYLYGKIETLCEHYAHSNGIPVTALAEGLAQLLRNSQGRQVLGSEHRMLNVPSRSA